MSSFPSLLLAFCLAASSLAADAHGPSHATRPIATDEHAFGAQGDPKAATRTVTISMNDTMRFTPSSITVRQGETVTLAVRNDGKIRHELVLGTAADLAHHAELMRKHPGMEHDEPYMAHVEPGATQHLTWRFSRDGTFEFACLVPGHYEAGMKGVVTVQATPGEAAGAKAGPGSPPHAAGTLAEGEVRKIDLAAGKVTLRHGEIRNLEMAPMTMVFGVTDPALLQPLKVGDRVRFAAERRDGAIVITRMEPAP